MSVDTLLCQNTSAQTPTPMVDSVVSHLGFEVLHSAET